MKKRIVAGTFVAALMLALSVGCAPQQAAPRAESSADDNAEQAVEVAFSMDGNCETCHAAEAASAEDAACIASLHADMDCVVCHDDADKMQDAHAKATMEKAKKARLSKTTIDSSACISCHALEELSSATTDVTTLTDENGTMVNPHDLPATHLDDYITCVDCHSMHEEASTDENAVAMCKGCHHKDVYECNTCH